MNCINFLQESNMLKITIDGLDSPERFNTREEVWTFVNEFFGVVLEWTMVDGYPTAKFDDDIIIQIKPEK